MLDAEIRRIIDLGVTLELDSKVTDVLREMRDGGFDAVFLAVGAHIGKRAYIPAGEAAHILDAVTLLASMEGEERPLLGRRVVVYGGGNTAMDAARTARRLGAEEAIVVYRRTRERMPAHDFEVEEAIEEGVMMKWLSTIKQADEGRLVLERMELDDSGFPQPTGETEELEADSLVLALGQEADLSLLDGVPGLEIEDGVVKVDDTMMTGHPGLFAGGDMVPAERTVTVGVGHGKQAARNIDAWLREDAYVHPPEPEPASFEELNVWYYADAPRTVAPTLDTIRRQSGFDEVTQGLDESNALFEARRCLRCGNCFGCDNCYGVCPDNAVLKLDEGERYASTTTTARAAGSASRSALRGHRNDPRDRLKQSRAVPGRGSGPGRLRPDRRRREAAPAASSGHGAAGSGRRCRRRDGARGRAARTDHQQVQLVAEGGELLAGDAVDGAAVDIGEIAHALVGLLDHQVDAFTDRRRHQAAVRGRRDRDDFQRLHGRSARRGELACERDGGRALGRAVVGDADARQR